MPGTLTRAEALQFTHDGRPDVFVLVNGAPVFLYGPGQYGGVITVNSSVTDISVLERKSPSGLDLLVGATSTGLKTWRYSDGATPILPTAEANSGAWASARRLRTVDLDDNGGTDLIGISADGGDLLIWKDAPDAGGTRISHSLTGYEAYDVVAANWCLDDELEIVMVTSIGLVVVRYADLTPVFSIPLGGEGDVIAVIEQEGSDYDLVCNFIDDWLFVSSNFVVQAPLPMGNVDVVAAVAGDWDNDGVEDLIISHQASHDVLVLVQEASGPNAFEWGTGAELLPLGGAGTATNNFAWPLAVDVDNDGDGEIMVGYQTDGAFVGFRNDSVDASLQTPLARVPVYHYYPMEDRGELVFLLDPPTEITGTYDHLQVVVWKQDQAAVTMDPVAVTHRMIPLASWPIGFEQAIPHVVGSEDVYQFEFRLVAYDEPTQKILSAAPTSLGAFSTYSATAFLLDFAWDNVSGASWSVPILDAGGVGGPNWPFPGPGSTGDVEYTPEGSLPDFDEDEFPETPAPGT